MNNLKVRLRMGYLPGFKETPHKLSFNYKRKSINFTIEAQQTPLQSLNQG